MGRLLTIISKKRVAHLVGRTSCSPTIAFSVMLSAAFMFDVCVIQEYNTNEDFSRIDPAYKRLVLLQVTIVITLARYVVSVLIASLFAVLWWLGAPVPARVPSSISLEAAKRYTSTMEQP